MVCRNGACEGAFRVAEIRAFDSCGRRPDVLPADAATTRLLAPLLKQFDPHADGLFELKLRLYWPEIGQDLVTALADDLRTRGRRTSEDERSLDLASVPAGELATWMSQAYGSDWVTRTSASATDEVLRAEKQKFEQMAGKARWWNWSRWTMFWTSFLIVLVIFLHSIHLFFLRLYHYPDKRRERPLRTPLLTQIGIGAICVCVPFFTRYELWPGLLILPALMAILPAEAWAWLRHKPRTSHPQTPTLAS